MGFLRVTEKWYFQGKNIEVVSAYKYMGLFVTPNLKLIWTDLVQKKGLATQAQKINHKYFKDAM